MGHERDDHGFTLIELMVVVLIIAILLAIAIPTFLGARERANIRATQSNIRNAHTNAVTYFATNQEFTADVTVMASIEPAYGWTNALNQLRKGKRDMYVAVEATSTPNDTLLLASKSENGLCYWLRDINRTGGPQYGINNCTGKPFTFTDSW